MFVVYISRTAIIKNISNIIRSKSYWKTFIFIDIFTILMFLLLLSLIFQILVFLFFFFYLISYLSSIDGLLPILYINLFSQHNWLYVCIIYALLNYYLDHHVVLCWYKCTIRFMMEKINYCH